MACSQAGPTVVAAIIKTTQLAQQAVNPAGFENILISANFNHMLALGQQCSHHRHHSKLGQLFHNMENYTAWSKVTNEYLQTQASKECDKFVNKNTLAKIGTKVNGVWFARHRLYHLGMIDTEAEEQTTTPQSLGFNADPFLLDTFSPLAWSIAIHSYYVTTPTTLSWRPSAISHRSWPLCHCHSLRYGVILGYQKHFKEDGTSQPLYGLISTCMMSKLTHVTPMEGKDVNEFLLAMNVLIGEVGVPAKLYIDQ